MKLVKSLLMFITLTTLIFVAVACEDSTSGVTEDQNDNGNQGVTQEESQEIALEYLLNSLTYLFDGIDGSIELVNTLTARCPSCWVFAFEFESGHAGYGDRADQMLAQVITKHTANIGVNNGEVDQAVMDGKWSMIKHELMEPCGNDQEMTNVAGLFADPVYDTLVAVEGEVTILGELLCPCFVLVSGGETVHVWYDLMIEDDDTPLPAVDIQGIENGDWVTVTGQLKQAGQHSSLNDFWATSITTSDKPVIIEDPNDGDGIVGGTPGSAGYSWDAEHGGWHRNWDPDSFIPGDQKPEWNRFIPEPIDGTVSDDNLPQIRTATVINVSCEEFQQLESPAVISKELKMNVGDTVTIVLCSNPTTGFSWQEIEVSDVAVLEVVERSFVAGVTSELVGFPGSETINLKALDEGTSTMTIAYSRPWDGGEKGEWTFNLVVNVTGETVVEEPDSDVGGTTVPVFADLVSQEWVLVSLGDPDNPQTVLEDAQITINFTEEENVAGVNFSGSAGCNSYFGSFDITEEGLVPGPIGATEMWCVDEAVMDQEGQFLGALATVSGYEADGDILEMPYNNGVLIFTAE